ncbi:hypothetical protein BJF79_41870 [Actinomadura sp. CNU-125]|nr:hypothetical protein BJF79_41870 [Actinomadura sp. CNU-125]
MEWAAEHEITADAAAELVGERFPELRGAPVEPLATGWDNTVFRVGGEWAFRFPRRKIALPGVEREIATLAALAPHLPLPIPVPRYVGEPGGGFPWPFWGARLLPGRELAEVRPPGRAPARRSRPPSGGSCAPCTTPRSSGTRAPRCPWIRSGGAIPPTVPRRPPSASTGSPNAACGSRTRTSAASSPPRPAPPRPPVTR